MQICPNCRGELTTCRTDRGLLYLCSRCNGRAVSMAVLRRRCPAQVVNQLWLQARQSPYAGRECPHCRSKMALIYIPRPHGMEPVALEICCRCQGVWFDDQEFEILPAKQEAPSVSREPSAKARETMALFDLQSQTDRYDLGVDGQGPDHWWQTLLAFLGMPVECESSPLSCRPWVTWGLSLVMAALTVALIARGRLEPAVMQWGLIPNEWARHGGLTLLTSFLLHGGLLHLLGNLYFLMVFGDNVEDHLGHWRLVAMLLGAHLAGAILHGAYDPRSDIPLIGASAGISGVIAYYGVCFPRAKIGLVFGYWYWGYFRWVRIPAVLALAGYILMQLAGAWMQVQGFSNVSALGHLGGAVVGLAVALYVRLTRRRGAAVASKDGLAQSAR